MVQMHVVAAVFSVGLTMGAAGMACAQDYPTRPIRIVTSGIGGGSDFASRQISQVITGSLGQPVVVDNRTAALASAAVSKAPPDGYTLLAGSQGIWIMPLLQKSPYDVSDFTPISLISREVSVLTVHPALPVKSVKDLVALAKARPGQLNYGAAVIGGPQHLAGELFKSLAGVDIVRVAYKGTAAALTAEMTGEVQMSFVDGGAVMPHIRAQKLRALAITNPSPSALYPGLPTVAASGVPGFESVGMTTMMAPARTPAAIINRLNQEVVRALNQPEVKERFFKVGAEIVASSPEELAAVMKTDSARTAKVIKEAGIKLE